MIFVSKTPCSSVVFFLQFMMLGLGIFAAVCARWQHAMRATPDPIVISPSFYHSYALY
jgi:hypothetical protein